MGKKHTNLTSCPFYLQKCQEDALRRNPHQGYGPLNSADNIICGSNIEENESFQMRQGHKDVAVCI